MIKVSLPNPNDYSNDIDLFLRHLELSLHHTQKAWEEIKKDATEHPEEYAENWKENYWITFRHPKMDLYERESDKEGCVKVHLDEEGDQMQHIELEINS